jgi:hypothetical protein
MAQQSLQQVLWVLTLVLAAGLSLRLILSRLNRVYVWFFVFLCFQVAQAVVMLPFKPTTALYGWIFLFTQPIKWFLCILVVLELYSLALRGHQGIATLGRWMLTAAVFVAVGFSAVSLYADLGRPVGRFPVLVYYSVIERGLMFSLVLFLLLITAFLVWSPIAVRRNIVLHAGVFSFYFLSSAMTLFVRNLAGYELTRIISTVLLLLENLCYVLWIVFLNRRGEEKVMVVRRGWRAEDEARLAQQLDAVNTFLLRSLRK